MLQNQCCNTPSYINEYRIQKQLCNKDCQEINNTREVWRGRSPSILNPQQRHARCGAVSARKICQWHIFSEQRAGRPRAGIFTERSVPGPTGPLLGEEEPLALPPGPRNPRGAKIHSLRLCRLGFAAPGKQASGLFSARTGRQALDAPHPSGCA